MNRNHLFVIILLALLLSGSNIFFTEHSDYYRIKNNYEEWLAENALYREQRYSAAAYNEIAAENLTIDEYYYNPSTHRMVIDFFVRVTGSERISLPIIYHAEQNDIPLAVMFSIAWVESKFKPYAYNLNSTTIDRGLFQLNSASFYQLELEEFFNPEINALHAGKYFRYCLDKAAGDYATALAIYNAGLGRVRRGTIPSSTKVYISRVLEYRSQLIRRFNAYIASEITRIQETQQS